MILIQGVGHPKRWEAAVIHLIFCSVPRDKAWEGRDCSTPCQDFPCSSTTRQDTPYHGHGHGHDEEEKFSCLLCCPQGITGIHRDAAFLSSVAVGS